MVCLSMNSIFNISNAQPVIMVEHQSGISEYFVDFQNALSNAQTGDFYLPVGLLHKDLKLFGAGHYPDPTLATNQTIITGNITISDVVTIYIWRAYISVGTSSMHRIITPNNVPIM